MLLHSIPLYPSHTYKTCFLVFLHSPGKLACVACCLGGIFLSGYMSTSFLHRRNEQGASPRATCIIGPPPRFAGSRPAFSDPDRVVFSLNRQAYVLFSLLHSPSRSQHTFQYKMLPGGGNHFECFTFSILQI